MLQLAHLQRFIFLWVYYTNSTKLRWGRVYYIIDIRQLRSVKSAPYRNCDRPTFGIYKALPPNSMNNDTVSDRPGCKALCPSCIAERRRMKKRDIKMQ